MPSSVKPQSGPPSARASAARNGTGLGGSARRRQDQPHRGTLRTRRRPVARNENEVTDSFESVTSFIVGEGGLEPPRPEGHWHLKPARLPFRHSPQQSGEPITRGTPLPNRTDPGLQCRQQPPLRPRSGS